MAIGDYDNDGWPDIYIAILERTGWTIIITMELADVAEKAGVALGAGLPAFDDAGMKV